MALQIEFGRKRALSPQLLDTLRRHTPAPNRPVAGSQRRNRNGVTLVLALLCLAVSTILVANLIRVIRLESQNRARYVNVLQADRLARAAIDRAAHQWSVDPSYNGETWDSEIPVRSTTRGAVTNNLGHVTITLSGDQPGTVTVTARYPVNQRHTITKTLTRQLSTITSITE